MKKICYITVIQASNILQDSITTLYSYLKHRATVINPHTSTSTKGKYIDEYQRIEYERIFAGDGKFLTGFTDSVRYPLKSLKQDLYPSFIENLYLITGQVLVYITIYSKAQVTDIYLFDECIKHSLGITVSRLIQYLI